MIRVRHKHLTASWFVASRRDCVGSRARQQRVDLPVLVDTLAVESVPKVPTRYAVLYSYRRVACARVEALP